MKRTSIISTAVFMLMAQVAGASANEKESLCTVQVKSLTGTTTRAQMPLDQKVLPFTPSIDKIEDALGGQPIGVLLYQGKAVDENAIWSDFHRDDLIHALSVLRPQGEPGINKTFYALMGAHKWKAAHKLWSEQPEEFRAARAQSLGRLLEVHPADNWPE